MPDLETLHQQYEGQGVLVFGIHPGDPPGLVAAFVEQTGITYPVIADQGTRSMFSYPPGSQYPYPRDVVVDKAGIVRSVRNSFDIVETTALVEQLLAE